MQKLFRASAKTHANKTAVVARGNRLEYRQLESEALRLATELRRLGAREGDRIAVLVANSAEAVVTIWAVLEMGCVLVPLHAAARPESLQPVLQDADPRWLVAGGELSAAFPAILGTNRGIVNLVAWSALPAKPLDTDTRVILWSLASVDVPLCRSLATSATEEGRLAALIYTSGSTGPPKGVMLSHANMRAAVRAVNAYMRLDSTDIIYSALPISSSYGIYQVILALAVGATIVLDRSFAFPATSLALAAAERATVFAGVPTMYAWIANSQTIEQYDLGCLRMLTSAAAALPLEHARRVRERLPHARLFVMYGQTECKRITYLDPDDFDRKPGSVGRGMPYQEHVVVDESGLPVLPGGIGELAIRGPHVMQGYWQNAAATAKKLRPLAGSTDLWLHTDDLFQVDEDGYLYFVGRRDDVFKAGGNKVSPREIEEVLCQMPEVHEAAVLGVPDPEWGYTVKAHVVLLPGRSVTENEVIHFCSSRLRAYMVPRSVTVSPELPKTESGKVKRRDLT